MSKLNSGAASSANSPRPDVGGRLRWPLYAAGFTTAFGAHSIAANLGVYSGRRGSSLLVLGILLALYDGAEVLFKPVFGRLVDSIGARPVLVGGLIAFAAASFAFLLAQGPATLVVVRLGQGAAASAFSPAASSMVARLAPGRGGGAFGSYGAWKGLGYAAGPVLGSGLVAADGFDLLFGLLGGIGIAVAVWSAVVLPGTAPLPKRRSTIIDLLHQLRDRRFLAPTTALAGATGALSAGVGFLPVVAHDRGLGTLFSGIAVSLLAATAAIAQPRVGRAYDNRRLSTRTGLSGGLAACALGLVIVAGLADVPGLLIGACTKGIGTALITPIGFAYLARNADPERIGATLGAAEVGRELGDAGGPLLVGALAITLVLTESLAGLAIVLAMAGLGLALTHLQDQPAPSRA